MACFHFRIVNQQRTFQKVLDHPEAQSIIKLSLSNMKYTTEDSKDMNASNGDLSTFDKHSELRHSIEGLNSNSEDEAPPAYAMKALQSLCRL